ncbi:ISAzo13 family transposase [Chloroflexi bacterium TSY]|nr:ISAzo13 family transposase [Chloroflexi bacterium TSY]
MDHRNEQFEHIAELKASYGPTNNPILSMDTKKKEQIGNFYRDGRLYTDGEIHCFDHDFASFADGVVIPHALYDLKLNRAFINIGTSRDTTEFACDSIRNWWYKQGQFDYPDATSILILCDGGGSNNSRYHIFKQDLQALVDEIGIEIRIAHFPPYCSKYNPIEHRLFPRVTRACQGVIFKSVEFVAQLIANTKTQQGLSVTVDILNTTVHQVKAR